MIERLEQQKRLTANQWKLICTANVADLLDFFAVRPKVQSKPEALPAPRPIRAGFEFRDVCFAYPDSSRLVLDRLNFRIEPRQRIAGEIAQEETDHGVPEREGEPRRLYEE